MQQSVKTLFGYRITHVRSTVPDSDIIVGAIVVLTRNEGRAIERTYMNLTTGRFSWGYDAKYIGPRCYSDRGQFLGTSDNSAPKRYTRRNTPRVEQFKRRRAEQ